jgi:hypothetical protein
VEKPRRNRSGGLLKTGCPPQNGENEANREWCIMKNEMPSLLLHEKTCFIRLPPDTLQNFWQVIM